MKIYTLPKVLIALAVTLFSTTNTNAQQTIFEIVEGSTQHTILELALKEAGLEDTLDNVNSDLTLFAPTDVALTAYANANGLQPADLLDLDNLADILLHHVVSGTVESGDLSVGEVTTLEGKDVTVNLTGGVFIDDAEVTGPNNPASNGVVHIIDDILLPTYDDVTEVVSLSPDHTTLLAALVEADLVETLQDLSKEYTVFAPTNAAFEAYLTANSLTATQLLAADNLSNILLQHVVSGTVLSSGLEAGEVTTLEGKDVTVNLTGGVFIDDAEVTSPDVEADNGVVHIIDDILLPTYDDVTEVVSLSPDHTTLLAALVEADLVETLQDLSKEYTVFAPTDDAFDEYLMANNLTATQLLAADNLSEILLNHVVSGTVLSTGLSAGSVETLNETFVTVNLTGGVFIDNAEVTSPDVEADNGVVHVVDDILVPSTTTSIELSIDEQLAVFPNPVTTIVNTSLKGEGEYIIVDLLGVTVLSGSGNVTTIDMSTIAPGSYRIILTSESKTYLASVVKY